MFNRFSANGSPINVRFSQRFQLSPQDLVLRQHAMWICIHHRLRYFTNILQQLSVTGYIGNLQIESNAALLCPFKSPGPRSFKSASAISKPSLVRTIISKRFLVSSANL